VAEDWRPVALADQVDPAPRNEPRREQLELFAA
jgi:hypothetical protein